MPGPVMLRLGLTKHAAGGCLKMGGVLGFGFPQGLVKVLSCVSEGLSILEGFVNVVGGGV